MSCLEFLNIEEIRAEYSDAVSDLGDEVIQRRIDLLSAALENELGHGFGRALIAFSDAADTVEVTSSALIIGGDTYSFSDYPTLLALVTAVNAAGKDYSLELLPHVFEGTPSDCLDTLAAVSCGPNYEDRQVLCLAYRYEQHSGEYTTHVFLDLPLASVASVVESGETLSSTDYWAIPGRNFLERKCCDCDNCLTCVHPSIRWKANYPGNILVKYIPQHWGRVPRTLRGVMLEAFGVRYGVSDEGLVSERFGPAQYSYTRSPAVAKMTWQDIIGGPLVRPYAVRLAVP